MDYSNVLVKYYMDYNWRCGRTYETLVWLDDKRPKPTLEELELKYNDLQIDEMREERNQLLRECDHCALPDFPSRELWLSYREQLRDFPSIWVEGMEFPMKPE